MIGEVAAALRAEARRANERRLLVLAGDRDAGLAAAGRALDGADADPAATTLVTASEEGDGERRLAGRERISPQGTDALLGTTRTAVVLDCHEECRPNAIGRATGVVDGGGLLLLLVPPLDAWPDRRDGFDATLAVPPFDADDVTGVFRTRLVETLRRHRGIAVVDVDAGTVERDGLTDPAPRAPPPPDPTPGPSRSSRSGRPTPAPPAAHAFPRAAYEACLTADQAKALAAFERLREPGNAVVIEADRGRGKSSAAGLAAGALAAAGRDVLVTAPDYRNAAEVLARAAELLSALDALVDSPADDGGATDAGDADAESSERPDDRHPGGGEGPRPIESATGGRVRFLEPAAAEEAASEGTADAVIVDEAAALPVERLSRFLDCGAVAFVTTVHGYEGAGRGFSVRFRDRLAESALDLLEVGLDEPIRYAPGDPIEVWAFRALLLDARPPVEPLVADATPGDVTYEWLRSTELLADEHRLREAFGLLVLAHYRTEPNDLARLLDAPNVAVRALTRRGHVVSVALLAREGGLDADLRRRIYEGARVKGNMLPDVLTSQLRDEEAGVPAGWRVLRIATHHTARSRGLGSRLLEEIRAEIAGDREGADDRDPPGETGARDEPGSLDDADWLGVGYGATPRLVDFWHRNGFATVHLSTTRNAASGEHSALMLAPLSAAGTALHDRHARWFLERVGGMLSDALAELDPDVVRAALRATDVPVECSLSAHDWRVVAAAAHGPGLARIAPEPFRRVALEQLADPADPDALSAREERLLVLRVFQARPPPVIADALGYDSTAECLRALGRAYRPLVDLYGTAAAREERDRYVG
ncbi:tRNA(Met) cytidine acetyltransferase [Halobacteriales archaeon QS_4_69_34]|nr:MAG: tRNA(Met) cytidine acetyltransferase [Halobacteriales archaeon QS_4_69_34]